MQASTMLESIRAAEITTPAPRPQRVQKSLVDFEHSGDNRRHSTIDGQHGRYDSSEEL